MKEGKGLDEKNMIKAFQGAKMICSGTQRYKCAPKLTGLGQIQYGWKGSLKDLFDIDSVNFIPRLKSLEPGEIH